MAWTFRIIGVVAIAGGAYALGQLLLLAYSRGEGVPPIFTFLLYPGMDFIWQQFQPVESNLSFLTFND